MILGPSTTQLFKQFDWVELPTTHETFSYNPCFFIYSVVQEVLLGSTNLNLRNILLCCIFSQLLDSGIIDMVELYTELMKYSSMILVLSITR